MRAFNLHIPWHPLAPETNNIYITGGGRRMPNAGTQELIMGYAEFPRLKRDFHRIEGKNLDI